MPDPITLVGYAVLALVVFVAVACVVADSRPKPQSRTRPVHSGRKSGRTAVVGR